MSKSDQSIKSTTNQDASKPEPQNVGPLVPDIAALRPQREPLQGRAVTLEPLSTKHTDSLFECIGGDAVENAAVWDYMSVGPFTDKPAFDRYISEKCKSEDPFYFAVLDTASGKAVGFLTLLRIDIPNRVVEVGWVTFSSLLQRTTAATEAMYLLAKLVFEDLGFRRYEWKCNDLNVPSKKAAERLGFVFEGVFRHHMIVKGRNRDTAWYSMLDGDWERVKRGFERWLDPGNFDVEGRQLRGLVELREELGN